MRRIAGVFGIVVSECSAFEYLADTRVIAYALKTMSLSTTSAELPGVFAGNPYPSVVNAPLWTLKFEVVWYLLLALLSAAGRASGAQIARPRQQALSGVRQPAV
jgi:peptidoglycan/LPS O-acetylase OafA/YrhL